MSVTFGVPKEFQVLQSPQNLPPVFNGEKLVVYANLKSQKALKKTNCTATLKGNMLGKKLEHEIRFTLNSSTTAPSLPVIHHLAAKALITDWEAAQKEKKSIVDLSIKSSVISSHTAFIAVDEESSEPVSGSMKVYDIMPSTREFFTHPALSMMCAAMSFGGPPPPSNSFFASPASASLSSSGTPPPMFDLLSSAPPPPPPGGAFLSTWLAGGAPPLPRSSQQLGGVPPPPPTFDLLSSAPPLPLRCGAILRHSPAGGAPPPPPLSQQFGGASGLFGSGRPMTKPTDTLASLISAQKLNGTWELTSSFAQLIGKPLADLEAACPIGSEGVGATVWATVLAVSLLRSRYSSQQDEWELIAMKAESWLKKQTLPSDITLEKIFQDAQKQLK